jgi:hypothetical protein
MSDPSLADAGLPPKRGWYDDPTTPGRDRWWSGFEWTEHTARTPRPSMFGPGYERFMRARPNRLALIGQWCAGAALVLLLGFIVALVVGVLTAADPSLLRALSIVLISQWFLAVAAIVLGAFGIRRARRWGGLPAAIYAIASGALAVSMPTVIAISILSR